MLQNKKTNQNILPGQTDNFKETTANEKNSEGVVKTEKLEHFADQREAAEKNDQFSSQAVNKKIRQQLEKMDVDDNLKVNVQSHANDIKSLQDKEKIKNLLKIAKEKGVVFAVSVAKKMDDPFVLDAFHDLLVKEGYYKNFLK